MHPAIFLDRDGVIIENRPNYVRSWADVEIYPQALQALASLRSSPYKLIIVTNQSGVGQGLFSLAAAQQINEQLIAVIEEANGRIDATYLCPHTATHGCPCRKPKPGLLHQAAQDHNINLSHSIIIGDALTDLAAGLAAGLTQTILLQTGRGQAQKKLPEAANFPQAPYYQDLNTAIKALSLAP